MRLLRRPRVWIAWGKRWAFQAYWYPCVSLGIHIDPRRPLVDVHFLVFILAVGKRPVITSELDRHRHTCRGFLFSDDPVL